ncbi:shieldin complex subunit 2 [Eublepharis macularius]|uniref:Shieldin complex subunit 2 n=1 Tax=Eublepharis macularius TaxID=481883 RepID=A0AA97JLR3_EUBMA|nr:shieldin complex subunit 2 [Eublepharis macularius]XP_054839323.1 shieldin complex subunit 2 [Eublepharis macularius]
MAGASQIYIFFGAPILSTSLKAANEENFLSATAEPWRKLHLSLTKDAFHVCTRKCQSPKHTQYPTTNDAVLASYTKNNFTSDFGEKCELTGDLLMNQVNDGINNKTKEADESAGIVCRICGNTNTDNHVKPLSYQQFPKNGRTDEQLIKLSEETEGDTKSVLLNHLHISPLVSSTQKISKGVTSVREDDDLAHFQCDHDELCDICGPEIAKGSKKLLGPRSTLALSTNTEFLSILTSSQVALLSGQPSVGQNETESESTKREVIELGGSFKVDTLIQLNEDVGTCSNAAERNVGQDYKSSAELFSSDITLKDSSLTYLTRENSFQKNAGVSVGLLCSPSNRVNNEINIQQWKSGILCSQGGNSPKGPVKRSQASEDAFAIADQQESKKPRFIYSSVFPVLQMEQLKTSSLKKVQKHPSLLKDCLCKDQKYNVLVTVLHPCHIKEIQIKSGTRLSPKVPLAIIVVFDQSKIQRKVVLWRAAAFWSLTVFPGDIVLLTDVGVYADRWAGEIILQSTFSSQLLNLGSCLAVHPNEFSHVVDINILQELLAYVSSRRAWFQALPQREPQTLNSIQNVLLDQLKADMLVHSVVKIVRITVLTESTYSYRGEKQKKIVLTVEQVKDQHHSLVLWGAAAAYCPQVQRKKDHLWQLKYLFAKHSPVSGVLELHTTPWTSFECLFDDDKRAVEFKEKFDKAVRSLMRVTGLPAHLEEKRSGVIQVRAHISELKFTIASSPCGQLVFDAHTSLQHIHDSLSQITYTGCAVCGTELQMDGNKIYKQCLSCLPLNKMKMFYRPAWMIIEDGGYEVCVRVVSELMEKMFLNIPVDWLSKTVEPFLDTTYSMIIADLCHSLVTDTKASYLLEMRSQFVLDENSCALEKNFHLLGLHSDLSGESS